MMKSKVTKMSIVVILMVAMLMSLVGCSKRSSSSSSTNNVSPVQQNNTVSNSNTSSVKTTQGGSNYGNSGNVNVNYNEKTLCSRCDGLGECLECFGEGDLNCDSYCIGGRCIYCSDNGKILVDFDSKGNPKYRNCPYCYNGSCKKCNGTGRIDCRYCTDGNCPSCHGSGYI